MCRMNTPSSITAPGSPGSAGLPPGPLTTAELEASVPDRRDRRRYERIWHGMYRRDDQPDGLLLRSRALTHAFPDGVLRGRSAALLWGDNSAPEGALPEIWLPTTLKACEGRVYRYGTLPGYAVSEFDGMKVTTPLRTCRDLAVDLEFEDAVVAVERLCAMVAELPAQLRAAIEHPSGRGRHRFARVVSACDPGSFSALSTRARLLLADADCGEFGHGHRVVLGAGTIELPLADPVARCAVFTAATQGRRDRTAARRQSLLQGAGWSVIIVREREQDRGAPSATPSIGTVTVTSVSPGPESGASPGTAAGASPAPEPGPEPGPGPSPGPGMVPERSQVGIPRRAARLLAVRWPATELRLPADGGPADDPHGLWGAAG